METRFNLVNFYAVELLHSVFNLIDPVESEIRTLEHQLKKYSYHFYRQLYTKNSQRLHILIVSPSSLEQNILLTMLESRAGAVHQARDKASLLNFLSSKKPYDVVIVSEHFKEIGLAFFQLYFHASLSKKRPRLIYLGDPKYQHGFTHHLKHPFFTQDLLSLL